MHEQSLPSELTETQMSSTQVQLTTRVAHTCVIGPVCEHHIDIVEAQAGQGLLYTLNNAAKQGLDMNIPPTQSRKPTVSGTSRWHWESYRYPKRT